MYSDVQPLTSDEVRINGQLKEDRPILVSVWFISSL